MKINLSYFIAWMLIVKFMLYLWYFVIKSIADKQHVYLYDTDLYFYWSCGTFIWIKVGLMWVFVLFRNFVSDRKIKFTFFLLALFFAITVLWEIAIIIHPPLIEEEAPVFALFLILTFIISCITYMPFIKRTWQKLN